MTGERFLYTPFYCEENVWQLCQHPQLARLEKRVVFISNQSRSCPFWSQRASADATTPVTWDYHVILICKTGNDGSWEVWDLDTTLGMPVEVEHYIDQTFRHVGMFETPYHPLFKVLDAEAYVRTLSSDRSHMLDADGRWLEPPPDWPEIKQAATTNLMNFIDMNEVASGEIMNAIQLRSTFATFPDIAHQSPPGGLGHENP